MSWGVVAFLEVCWLAVDLVIGSWVGAIVAGACLLVALAFIAAGEF